MKTNPAPTQNQLILAALMADPGIPIPMPKLADLSESMNVHTRVADVNKLHGKIIWNLSIRHGRRWHSCYYYRPLSDPNKEPAYIPAA